MKQWRRVLVAPILPPISESLEDQGTPTPPLQGPPTPALLQGPTPALQGPPTLHSLDDYTASIRALARPPSALPAPIRSSTAVAGPIRAARGQRPRPSHAKARSLRPRYGLVVAPGNQRDPVDWLFGQSQGQMLTHTHRHLDPHTLPRTQAQQTEDTNIFLPSIWML
ncbi:protein DEPP1-like [Engraulis encrasicolus]|uniref:protein DEPP1-like n=1 Tax=Engraulis encrasicolus TaxID=184585 RepID=UPI002FD7645E